MRTSVVAWRDREPFTDKRMNLDSSETKKNELAINKPVGTELVIWTVDSHFRVLSPLQPGNIRLAPQSRH